MEIGHYKILEKIGEGGMGIIYKAVHSTLQQTVAIKALPSSISSNIEIRERFIREATIQAKISHPNIVNLLNFFEVDGNYYIVMEYVEGETLEAMIKRLGLIPPDRCLSIFEQVLVGIEFAHDKGIVHRDIKPGNIMVSSQGTVKIMDFGIAKIAGGINLTKAGVKLGTVWYMSPEQVKGHPATVSTDIYSLGVTLFEMVTGKVPFYSDSQYKVMKIIVESLPASPKDFYPYIPDCMEKAILKALSKSPVDRFRNVKEFATALTEQEKMSGKILLPESPLRKSNQFSVLEMFAFSNKQLLWAGVGLLIVCCLVFVAMIKTNTSASIKSLGVSVGTESSPIVVPRQPAENSSEKVVTKPTHEGEISNAVIDEEKEKIETDIKNKVVEENKVREKIRSYLERGKQYHEDGKFSEARKMYNKVLKIDRSNKAAREGIIDAYQAEKALLVR